MDSQQECPCASGSTPHESYERKEPKRGPVPRSGRCFPCPIYFNFFAKLDLFEAHVPTPEPPVLKRGEFGGGGGLFGRQGLVGLAAGGAASAKARGPPGVPHASQRPKHFCSSLPGSFICQAEQSTHVQICHLAFGMEFSCPVRILKQCGSNLICNCECPKPNCGPSVELQDYQHSRFENWFGFLWFPFPPNRE